MREMFLLQRCGWPNIGNGMTRIRARRARFHRKPMPLGNIIMARNRYGIQLLFFRVCDDEMRNSVQKRNKWGKSETGEGEHFNCWQETISKARLELNPQHKKILTTAHVIPFCFLDVLDPVDTTHSLPL